MRPIPYVLGYFFSYTLFFLYLGKFRLHRHACAKFLAGVTAVALPYINWDGVYGGRYGGVIQSQGETCIQIVPLGQYYFY